MIRLTLLETEYLKDALDETREFLEDQYGKDQYVGDVTDSILNALEIVNAAICNNVIDEEIPMSIETWLNPRA